MRRETYATMRGWSCAALMAVMILGAVGCAKESARVARPPVMSEIARTALAALERRLSEIHTVRAMGRIYVWDRGEMVSSLAVVVGLPDRVRLEASDSLADVTMAAGARGKRVWVWLPAENRMYRGSASRSNLKMATGVDWEIEDLVHTLAGTVNVEEGDALIQGEADKDMFAMSDKPIAVRMDMKRELPLMIERTKRVGGIVKPHYEVRFDAYRDVNGIAFPHRIVAHVPGRGSRVVVEYDEVELNKSIDDSVFEAPKS